MTSTRRRALFPLALASLLAALAACRGEDASLAFDGAVVQAAGVGDVALTSTSFADGQPIPLRHSAYATTCRRRWPGTVAGAASYALLMEDPDADRRALRSLGGCNIPAVVAALPAGLAAEPVLAARDGKRRGLNARGSSRYSGLQPAAGSGVHHYHVQLFALDTTLDIAADADRNALVKAMRGHVLGRARLVGTYAAPEAPAP